MFFNQDQFKYLPNKPLTIHQILILNNLILNFDIKENKKFTKSNLNKILKYKKLTLHIKINHFLKLIKNTKMAHKILSDIYLNIRY